MRPRWPRRSRPCRSNWSRRGPSTEAISTAGGVLLTELDEACMVRKVPGLFCAGEMLDWEAPTGGYLLTASMGQRADRWGRGAVALRPFRDRPSRA